MPNSYAKGFTLVEVLVAITLLITVIFWPISIIAENLIVTAVTERTVKAHLLAQSTIEYVRAERDRFILTSSKEDGWVESLRADDSDFKNCIVSVDKDGTQHHYCVPLCGEISDPSPLPCGRKNFEQTDNQGDVVMTENPHFVVGVSKGDPQLKRTAEHATCDGKTAADNGELSATLRIKLPSKGADVQYALIISCVSWKEPNNDTARKIEFREALYDWIIRKDS